MGNNRGRKAGGGSKDFGAGLKYNSRIEVGKGRGPGAGRPQFGSSRTGTCARPRFRPSSALLPVGGPGLGAQVEFPVRWVPGRWKQGGAGRTSAPDQPCAGHRGGGKPQGPGASGRSCLLPSPWLEKRTSVRGPHCSVLSVL